MKVDCAKSIASLVRKKWKISRLGWLSSMMSTFFSSKHLATTLWWRRHHSSHFARILCVCFACLEFWQELTSLSHKAKPRSWQIRIWNLGSNKPFSAVHVLSSFLKVKNGQNMENSRFETCGHLPLELIKNHHVGGTVIWLRWCCCARSRALNSQAQAGSLKPRRWKCRHHLCIGLKRRSACTQVARVSTEKKLLVSLWLLCILVVQETLFLKRFSFLGKSFMFSPWRHYYNNHSEA